MRELAKEYIKPIALQMFFTGIMYVFMDLFYPLIYSLLFDSLQSGNLRAILNSCLFASIIVISMIILEYYNNVILDTCLWKATYEISIFSVSRYHMLPFYKTSHYEEGDMFNRLYSGGQELPSIWLNLTMAIADFLSIFFLVVLCYRWSIQFSIVSFLFVIAILVFVKLLAYKANYFANLLEERKGKYEKTLHSVIYDAEFLMSNGIEDYAIADYEKQRDNIWTIKKQEVVSESRISALSELIDHIVRLLVPFFGFLGKNTDSYGAITSTYSTLESIRSNTPSLFDMTKAIQHNIEPINRLSEVVHCSAEQIDMLADQNQDNSAVSVRNVSLQRGERRILANISLDIPVNQKVVVIGKNGCGKSTLLRVILGLYKPDLGKVTIRNGNVSDFSHTLRRSVLTYAPASSQLFDNTVSDNISMGVTGSINDTVNLHDRFVFLDDVHSDHNGSKLSGGQAQRVNIARALVNDADIILLDEPTSALDESNCSIIFNLIANMKKTVIVVTHNLDYIEIFDRIIYMEDGKIVEDKLVNEIDSSEKIKRWVYHNEME